MAYSRSACWLVGPISSRRCIIWMIAASCPESRWKSDGGLISTRSNGRWWSSITNVMVKSTDFWVSGIVQWGQNLDSRVSWSLLSSTALDNIYQSGKVITMDDYWNVIDLFNNRSWRCGERRRRGRNYSGLTSWHWSVRALTALSLQQLDYYLAWSTRLTFQSKLMKRFLWWYSVSIVIDAESGLENADSR